MKVLFRSAALFFGITAVPSLALAQSGWFWQNPFPTGNWLHGVATPDPNTAIAIGGLGTIVHTTDGGATWTLQDAGGTARLWGVFFLDADTGWVVGESGTIFHTTDGGATWTPQDSGTYF